MPIPGRRAVVGGLLALMAAGPSSRVGAQEAGCGLEISPGAASVVLPVGRANARRGGGDNVLFVVADDLGVGVLECYGEGSVFPPTPTIDQLRDSGILFRNAYSNPVCSPTRATIQTGRYSFRTGVGSVVGPKSTNGLPFSEITIPEILDLNATLGYHHAAIGKWHLTSDSQGEADGPNLSGYSHFAGSLRSVANYFSWTKTENGEQVQVDVYATTQTVNDAIEWIEARGDDPWFVWLAFNAPHSPFHAPPQELHSYDLPDDATDVELYRAMVEALDTELGRLLNSIASDVLERTTAIFLGDNGTPAEVTVPPFDPDHAKGTLYEGGIHVPLIISGPQVVAPGTESLVQVNTTDLFATALELMGVDVTASLPEDTALDSLSLLPVLQDLAFEPREFIYAEQFNDNHPEGGGATIHDQNFKLIRFNEGTEEFFDLNLDPLEITDLLAGGLDPMQQAAYDKLTDHLDDLINVECEGDANGDGLVDPLDSGFVLARYGCRVGTGDMECDTADQNGDGEVDPLDGGFVLARFGLCP